MKIQTVREHDWKIYPFHLETGLFYEYPICCIMYFQYVHPVMKYAVPEYYQCKKDRIMCPDCLIHHFTIEGAMS